MPSPFPGMDPFLEKNPIFQELHTQMLAEAQAQLQPQLRPKYVARLERHLSEGSVWGMGVGAISLEGKEPDITVIANGGHHSTRVPQLHPASPSVSVVEELDADELQLRKQRRIVIYVQGTPRLAVASIELLSPSNKEPGSVGQTRYLEKRSSALHGGLHWIEIDLLRAGQRPPIAARVPKRADYLAYVAQATATGWNHLVYAWKLRDPMPRLPIPLLGHDLAVLDLESCFAAAYDRIAADTEADYAGNPPPPPLGRSDGKWLAQLLRKQGLRE